MVAGERHAPRLAKILENMEIGHNVMHGQWDWMNDPEIHSSTWEWDTAQPAEQWKHSHNYIHHQFTNVLGKDNDIGYGILRMAREQKWHPVDLGQPVYNALLACLFQWGVALHDLDLEAIRKGKKDPKEMKRQLRQIAQEGPQPGPQGLRDLPGPHREALEVDHQGQRDRELHAQHLGLPDHLLRPLPRRCAPLHRRGARGRDPPEWYLRQVLGTANFEGSQLLHVMTGNLGYQIEHHLFPDLPSNRYAEISVKVRALCDKYGIPYTTGPLHQQYGQVLRVIHKLSLPERHDLRRQAAHRQARHGREQPALGERAPDPPSGAGRLVPLGGLGACLRSS